jgi:hypothetical protein
VSKGDVTKSMRLEPEWDLHTYGGGGGTRSRSGGRGRAGTRSRSGGPGGLRRGSRGRAGTRSRSGSRGRAARFKRLNTLVNRKVGVKDALACLAAVICMRYIGGKVLYGLSGLSREDI